MSRRPNPAAGMRAILESRDGKQFKCDVCGFDWPEYTRREQSGLDVSTMCHYEPNGYEQERNEARADAARLAGELTARAARVSPQPPGADWGTVRAVTEISPNPIQLSVGGSSVSVVLTGVELDSSVTFDYGDAGITDATSPSVDSATQVTLDIQAGGGVSAGDYDLTVSGSQNQIFRDVIQVRV